MRRWVAEAILLAALVAGRRRGSFLGKKPTSGDGIVRTSRRCAVAHHFYPRNTNSYVLLRKNDDEDVNRFAGRFWGTVPAIDQAEPEPGEEEFYLVVDS